MPSSNVALLKFTSDRFAELYGSLSLSLSLSQKYNLFTFYRLAELSLLSLGLRLASCDQLSFYVLVLEVYIFLSGFGVMLGNK